MKTDGQSRAKILNFPFLESANGLLPCFRNQTSGTIVILLVEDNEKSRHALAHFLALRGHRVIQASDGEQALTMLGEGYPIRLVITDLAMPKITGFGLLIRMRQKWPNLPLVLVTGYLSPQVANVVLNNNVKFLSKPIDLNELISAVEGFGVLSG